VDDPACTVFDDAKMGVEECHFFVGEKGGFEG
jgi:hypothetical protein